MDDGTALRQRQQGVLCLHHWSIERDEDQRHDCPAYRTRGGDTILPKLPRPVRWDQLPLVQPSADSGFRHWLPLLPNQDYLLGPLSVVAQ